jgi:hypothetical protein
MPISEALLQCHFPGEIGTTPSKLTSVAGCSYKVTLKVLLRFFVRQHVDPCMARATQIDRTPFDSATHNNFFVFLVLMPRAWNKMMRGDLTPLTVA